jgi:rod shape-determining protein MreD
MRWLTFLLAAAVVLTLQSALAPFVELFGARPDWLLVLVVVVALFARPTEAVVGAWIIGFCADLMTIERLGLMALSYMLAALFVISIRGYLFRYRATTQFAVTLMASLLVRAAWLVYRRALYDYAEPIFLDLAVQVVLASIYTAVWAWPAHKCVLPLSRWLGLPRPRYTHAGLDRTAGAHV